MKGKSYAIVGDGGAACTDQQLGREAQYHPLTGALLKRATHQHTRPRPWQEREDLWFGHCQQISDNVLGLLQRLEPKLPECTRWDSCFNAEFQIAQKKSYMAKATQNRTGKGALANLALTELS